MYYVYMIRCRDNSIYTGITNDLDRRVLEHFSRGKKCARYTYVHIAIKLECAWECSDRSTASKLEYFIKRLSKDDKEKLIVDNYLCIIGDKIDISLYNRIK